MPKLNMNLAVPKIIFDLNISRRLPGLSSDFRKADGSAVYPDFDLKPLLEAPGVEMAYLDNASELSRRIPDVGFQYTAEELRVQSLIALRQLDSAQRVNDTLLNRAQAWQLLYSVFDELRFDRRKTLSPRILLDDALALASRCADHLRTADEVAADCELIVKEGRWKMADKATERLELTRVVEAYERRKRERHLIDYGDQIRLAVRLMQHHPEVAQAAREQHPVVLLDEYQDTNFAQRRLLQLIYEAVSEPASGAINTVRSEPASGAM